MKGEADGCLSTLDFYTTLKRKCPAAECSRSLSTLDFYTTLKQDREKAAQLAGLSTLDFYTTLKHVVRLGDVVRRSRFWLTCV